MADNPFNLDFKEFIKKHQEAQAESNRLLQEAAAGPQVMVATGLAKDTLKAQEKTLEQQIFASGLNQQQIEKVDLLNMSVKEAEKRQAEQKAVLDELGIEAKDNAAYRKTSMDLERARLAQAKASGSKQAEEDAKKNIRELRSQTFLGKIANGIGDLRDKAKEKVKSIAKGGLMAFAFGAFAVAALAFLNSPFFDKTVDYITKTLLPKLKTFYDAFFGPKGGFVEGFKTLFGDVGGLGGVVLGLGTVTALLAANKIAKFFGPLKAGVGKLLSGIGGLAKRIPGLPGGGGAGAGGPMGAVSKTAGGIGAKIKAAGKGLGGFISGLLKGIASGLAAFANPLVVGGLLAVTAAIVGLSAAIRIMTPAFEPIGKMFESFGKTIKSVFEGLGSTIESIGEGIKKVITGIADGVGNVVDKITKMQTAGTEATTKQIKELSKIPADALHAAAGGIDAMKAALAGFGGGTFSKVMGNLFGGNGPIEKILELTKKVPELMQAAEALSVLGAAGSNYAIAEAELERRKKVAQLQKSIAGGRIRGKRAEGAKAELAALQSQAMPMSNNIGGNLGKIEGLVSEIVRMKREAAQAGGGIAVIGGDSNFKGGDSSTTLVSKKLGVQDPVTEAIAKGR